MGQAKRRRLAGSIPAEDFEAPPGSVTITAQVDGWISSLVIDAAKIVDIDAQVGARRAMNALPPLRLLSLRAGVSRVFPSICAGCPRQIGDVEALPLCDGNRVHICEFDCLIQHGRRWRGVAANALIKLGLQNPRDLLFAIGLVSLRGTGAISALVVGEKLVGLIVGLLLIVPLS